MKNPDQGITEGFNKEENLRQHEKTIHYNEVEQKKGSLNES